MVKPMAADLGWSRSAISAAIFLNMAVYAVSLLITGRLYDRYGPKWILAVSSLLFSVGYMLMATMGSLWEFYLYFGVGVGICTGSGYSPVVATISKWFVKRRALAIAVALTGIVLGQMAFSPLAARKAPP